MRTLAPALIAVAACTSTDPSLPDPGMDTLTVTVPDFTVEPGGEIFLCYHTSLPIDGERAISGYHSTMSPGSHHLVLFYVDEAQRPDGTLEECRGADGFGGASLPVWAYASQEPEGAMRLPDGVGIPIEARQPVVVNLHYFNLGDAPIRASVAVDLQALPRGASYEEAHAFITFNTEIEVPPGESATFGGSCAVPEGANFVALTTHSHQFTTAARILDGDAMVLETRDWEHPTVGTWAADPFLRFASGHLDYACDITNTSGVTLTVGESALENEMCLAGGFFFPADGDVFCLNSAVFQL